MELKPKKVAESKRTRYEEKLSAHLDSLLEPGETLLASSAASWQKSMFSQGVVCLATTDRRLIIQTLDRKGNIKDGQVVSLTPDDIESSKVGGAGGAWDDPSAVIMASSTIKLKIKTTSGQKYKFMLLHGGGIMGAMGGGASQKNGVESLLAFLGKSEAEI